MKESKRDYHMTNGELMMLASNLVVFMTRDKLSFEPRGVSLQDITDFETLGNAFEAFPMDEEYKGLITIEVDTKNILRSTLTNQIQTVSGYFEQEWSTDSGQYKRLGIKDIQHKSDSSFLVKSRAVVRIAGEYLSTLSLIGLTQSILDILESNAQLFEDKLNSIAENRALRDVMAKERTDKGNELYSFVKKYSTIGKLIWENVDEAKYNDYIIYHRPPYLPSKVQNLTYDEQSTAFNWDFTAEAANYELQMSINNPSKVWNQIYFGPSTTTNYDPGAGDWLFRCRGTNSTGNGTWSDELNVVITP